jgi:hypothetical protein
VCGSTDLMYPVQRVMESLTLSDEIGVFVL